MTPQALFREAVSLHRSGRLAEAAALCEAILAAAPDPRVYCLLAVLRRQQGRAREALAAAETAVAHAPGDADAQFQRGMALLALKRDEEAAGAFRAAALARPGHAEAWNNHGIALTRLGRAAGALDAFDHALTLRPGHAATLYNRAAALIALERLDDALAALGAVLAAEPGHVGALAQRGLVLQRLDRAAAALADYDRALARDPGRADIWNDRGNVLQRLRRFDEARASYDRALCADPDCVQALVNRGNLAATHLRDPESGLADLARAYALAPDFDYLRGDLLHLRMQLGDWRDHDAEVAHLSAGMRAGRAVIRPFAFLAISQSPADQQRCATQFAARHFPQAPARWRPRRHDRLRIGYLSGEFREQATAYLAAGLYERHDRNRFELFAFDNGRNDHSPIRARLETAFDRFIDIAPLGDGEAAARIADAQIDILVNLNGYFGEGRMGIFAMRPAPVQVSYLGFPGTLGAPYIDYVIADRIVIPQDERRFHAEQVVWLPGSYQANDSIRPAGDMPSRAAAGLPDGAFVFCNFNHSYKLVPAMFAAWLEILRQVPDSVLWLLESNPAFARNLRREAEAEGVAAARLVFAPLVPHAQHLARIGLADLVLDSLPYNAHTTASDALRAGVPVLTCRGQAFAGRVAASLLTAIGLPEMIAENPDAYRTIALTLARDRVQLAALKEKLAGNRLTARLFDPARQARHLEAAYETMWETFRNGRKPQAFAVPPDA